jgi:pimeloyl-ACP methyl ester carboxylesterase
VLLPRGLRAIIVLVIRERTLDTPGGPIRCLDAGAGWPVLLIHAFPLNADMWRPQLERVPDGWRYIAPDVRGFGSTPATRDEPSMEGYAADVQAVMDALEIEMAIVGGLSMGGYIALAANRRSPERLSGLVLADTRSEADTPEGRANRMKMSALVRSEGVSAVADQMIPKLLASRLQDGATAALVRSMIEGNSVEGVDGAINAMMNRPDSTPELSRLSLPVLVIVGEADTLTPPADSERLQRRTTRSQLVVLPGAGHLSNIDAPEAFSTALANFLASNL